MSGLIPFFLLIFFVLEEEQTNESRYKQIVDGISQKMFKSKRTGGLHMCELCGVVIWPCGLLDYSIDTNPFLVYTTPRRRAI